MKKFILILTAVVMTFNLTSCSSEDALLQQEETVAKSLLESYTLTRDARGSYSLVSKVADGVATELFQNQQTNSNEIHLFDGQATNQREINNNLALINNTLNIEFFEGKNKVRPVMTIIDGDVSVKGRAADGINFLNSYTIVSNDDGTYQFNFEVKDSVNVSYGYNEAEGINEIYLTDNGTAAAASYTKNYTLNAKGGLKVDFVHTSTSARGVDTRLRPRVVVGS